MTKTTKAIRKRTIITQINPVHKNPQPLPLPPTLIPVRLPEHIAHKLGSNDSFACLWTTLS
jgi:hypothetical protein